MIVPPEAGDKSSTKFISAIGQVELNVPPTYIIPNGRTSSKNTSLAIEFEALVCAIFKVTNVSSIFVIELSKNDLSIVNSGSMTVTFVLPADTNGVPGFASSSQL